MTTYEWVRILVLIAGFVILVDAIALHVIYLCKHWKRDETADEDTE